jgi:hypothetical protein
VESSLNVQSQKEACLATAFGKTQEMAEGHWAINVQAFIGKAREEFSLFAFKSPVKEQDAAQAIGQKRVQSHHVKVLGSP